MPVATIQVFGARRPQASKGAMTRTSTSCWVLAALLTSAATASAETFYSEDGVVFEGSMRLVVSNALTCNVLEEKYATDEYERLKANQGQPLHLWQVDWSVRNESGRPLEYLRASSWVHSEHPPCTNWVGEGPGRGPILPDAGSMIPIFWSDYLQSLQMPYGMRAGQEANRAIYLEVFRGHRPRFGDWDIDYRFATPSDAEQSRGSSGRRGGPARAAVGLPPEVQVDLNLRKAEQAVRDGDAATAREAMERLLSLQAEHGLEPALEDLMRYAEAWAAAGEPTEARAAAIRYLQLRGREAERYTEALDLINREGSLVSARADGTLAEGRIDPAGRAGVSAADAPLAAAAQAFDGMEFVWVPAGEFLMGSTTAEAEDDEQPVTRVRISKGFWLGKYEVTVGQWRALMGPGPMYRPDCQPCPVQAVSWNEAQEFIRTLNARTGNSRYRLPTEAEWEFAARAGTSADRYGKLDAIAWFGGGFDALVSDTRPLVGQKAPNAWGLHDMLGSVWEWVEDWYGRYPGGAVTDPRGPSSGSQRVTRGGSWQDGAIASRAPSREGLLPGQRLISQGFRLLRME